MMGMAVYVLLATVVGWFGSGFHTAMTASLSAGIALAALWQQRHARGLLLHVALMVPVGLVASTGILFCVLRFDSFNLYNDAFCYIVPAQWLQSHSFSQPCIASGYHPALTMVSYFQILHLRMGSTFLLGWLQSAFGLEWSYSAYPLAVALPSAVGSLALAGAIYGIAGKSRAMCLTLGMLAGTSLNGFSFGALHGFMGQTYGLAFGFAGVALSGVFVAWGGKWVRSATVAAVALPVSLCFAALIFSYPESAPFVAVGGAVYIAAVAAVDRSQLRRCLTLLGFTAVETAAIANVEFARVIQSVRTQFGAVVGAPVVWNPLYGLMHPSGFLSGPWEGQIWLLHWATPTKLAAGVVLSAMALGFVSNAKRRRTAAALPFLCMLVVSLVAFLYFRYFVVSPWDGKVGHSWNQFRVSSWATLYMLAVIGGGVAAAWVKYRSLRPAILVIALGWNLAGIAQNYRWADARTTAMRADTHSADPFSYYLQVRESLRAVSPADGIYLENFGRQYSKQRQLLTYFLSDYKLLSDWSDDDYVRHWLPPHEVTLPVQGARWVLSRSPGSPIGERRFGDLVLSTTGTEFLRSGTEGGYSEESDSTGWWHWTAHELLFSYNIAGKRPVTARVRFTYLPEVGSAQVRPLTIEFRNGTEVRTDSLAMRTGWGEYTSPPLQITEPGFILRLSSSDPPQRLSETDPRMAAFLAKNVVVEEVKSDTSLEQEEIKGGYASESDTNDWWRWTPHELLFRYRSLGKRPEVVRIEFTYLAETRLGQVRPLDIELRNGAKLWADHLLMKSGWSKYISPPISITEPECVLRLSSSQAPQRISDTDHRMAAFLVKNLHITTVSAEKTGGQR